MKHKTKIETVVSEIGKKFKYEADSHPKFLGDTWQVMKEKSGILRGDCDDFTLTCIWHYSDRKLSTFLKNVLVTRKCKIHRCKTKNGEWHIIGEVGDMWFDNWTLKAMSKDAFLRKTKHNITMQYPSYTILLFMVNGLLFDKK